MRLNARVLALASLASCCVAERHLFSDAHELEPAVAAPVAGGLPVGTIVTISGAGRRYEGKHGKVVGSATPAGQLVQVVRDVRSEKVWLDGKFLTAVAPVMPKSTGFHACVCTKGSSTVAKKLVVVTRLSSMTACKKRCPSECDSGEKFVECLPVLSKNGNRGFFTGFPMSPKADPPAPRMDSYDENAPPPMIPLHRSNTGQVPDDVDKDSFWSACMCKRTYGQKEFLAGAQALKGMGKHVAPRRELAELIDSYAHVPDETFIYSDDFQYGLKVWGNRGCVHSCRTYACGSLGATASTNETCIDVRMVDSEGTGA